MSDSVSTPASNYNAGNIQLSLGKSMNFLFHDGEHEIKYWASLYSGREKVYVDGRLVSKKWCLRTKFAHHFTIGNDDYVVKFDTENLFHFHFTCALIKNGDPFHRYEIRDQSAEQAFFKRNALLLLGGGIIGVLMALGNISLLTGGVLLVVGALFSVYQDISKNIQPVSNPHS